MKSQFPDRQKGAIEIALGVLAGIVVLAFLIGMLVGWLLGSDDDPIVTVSGAWTETPSVTSDFIGHSGRDFKVQLKATWGTNTSYIGGQKVEFSTDRPSEVDLQPNSVNTGSDGIAQVNVWATSSTDEKVTVTAKWTIDGQTDQVSEGAYTIDRLNP